MSGGVLYYQFMHCFAETLSGKCSKMLDCWCAKAKSVKNFADGNLKAMVADKIEGRRMYQIMSIPLSCKFQNDGKISFAHGISASQSDLNILPTYHNLQKNSFNFHRLMISYLSTENHILQKVPL